jgi:hypothetical protein
MSGYNREKKTFTLTAMKMEHYHRHHTHTTFPRKICPICNAQYGQEYMQMVAAFLTANEFDVVDVGDAHITISAPSKPRKKFGMWVTKESDALYQLLAGRIDPQPGSLPQDNSFLEADDIESSYDEVPASFQEIDSLMRLNAWLDDLKEQIHLKLQQAEAQVEHFSAMPEDSFEGGDREALEQAIRTVIACQAELALIDRIQSKTGAHNDSSAPME